MSADSKPVEWEKVYIFISSTFNDMHAERDFLVKKVFPHLAEWCERRKLRMVDIDLRWGVTEEEATRNRNVVEVCLNRIDECRPFFLCFLGQRYGWIPGRDDVSAETFGIFPGLDGAVDSQLSVTELEILHALVSPFHSKEKVEENAYSPAEHAFFYLRDDSYLEDLPSEPPFLRRTYTDEAEIVAEKREFLLEKNRNLREVTVPATGRPTVTYRAEWSEKERTPELATPLRCPALLDDNVARWQEQWKEAAGVHVDGRDVAVDEDEANRAEEFNARLTQGRLTNFTARGESLEELILRDLKAAISERFPHHAEVTEKDDLEKEFDQQERFLFINSEGFIHREGDFTALDSYVSGHSDRPFVLTAPAGMGKSTLLANWIDRDRTRGRGRPGESVHFRFIGQSDLSTTVPDLLHSLLLELQGVAGKIPSSTMETRTTPEGGEETVKVPLEIPRDPLKLREVWGRWLEEVGRQGRTILILDALDQLETGLSDLRWIPRRLPKNVKLIASFKRGGEGADELLARFERTGEAQVSQARPFDEEEDRRRLVRAYLRQYLKELDESHITDLINSPGATNPLFLKVVLSELRVFGIFSSLGEKVREDFGETPISAFHSVLKRLEGDPAYSPIDPHQAVPLIFGLLAHARHGLSAEELSRIVVQALGFEDSESSRAAAADSVHLFLRQVRTFLARREGRHDFFYESFGVAVRERTVARGTKVARPKRLGVDWHALLADYFHGLPTWQQLSGRRSMESPPGSRLPTRRKVAELPYHSTEAEDWVLVETVLCDLDFVGAKCAAGMTRELIADYRAALDALPEAKAEKDRELARGAAMMKYVEDLVTYVDAEAPAPEVIPAQRPWSEEQSDAAAEEMAGDSTRIPWVRAFSRFVNSETYALEKFGSLPGFTVQQALNSARGGPVEEVGADVANRIPDAVLLVRASAQRPAYTPYPALVRSFVAHNGPVKSVAVTSDGKRAVSGGGNILGNPDNTVRVWDLESGECLRTLEGHQKEMVTGVAITPDGRRAVSAGWDNTLRVWDLERFICLRTLEMAPTLVMPKCVQLSADGNKAVTAAGGLIQVWDLETGERLRTLKDRGGSISIVSATPNSAKCVSVVGNTLKIWDLEKRRSLGGLEGHTAEVDSVSITPDGKWAVSGARDMTVRVWDLIRKECVGTLSAHMGPVYGVGITPDGSIAVSGSADGTVRIWNLLEGKCVRRLEGRSSGVGCVAVTPDARYVVSGSGQSFIHVWDVERGRETEPVESHGGMVNDLTITPDNRRAVSASADHDLRIWGLESGECLGRMEGHTLQARSVTVTPDSAKAVSGSYDRTLRVWDLEGAECIDTLNQDTGRVERVKLTPDGGLVISGSDTSHSNRVLRLWDLQRREWSRTLKGPESNIGRYALDVTSVGTRAVSGSWDKTIRVWDLSRGKCLKVLKGHTAQVEGVGITPDGMAIVSASFDKTLRIWHLETGNSFGTLAGHTDWVRAVKVTPDGAKALSVCWNIRLTESKDFTVRVWDLQTGECVNVFDGHQNWIRELAITPDGARAVTGSDDRTVRVWDIESGECVAAYQAPSEVSSVSSVGPRGQLVCGTGTGNVVVFSGRNLSVGPPVVTATELWRFGDRRWWHGLPFKRPRGRLDEDISAVCTWCGQRFRVPNRVVSAATSICRSRVPLGLSPCLELPKEAWREPELKSACPNCGGALRFNPFIAEMW